jgi:hypothetical protein
MFHSIGAVIFKMYKIYGLDKTLITDPPTASYAMHMLCKMFQILLFCELIVSQDYYLGNLFEIWPELLN